MLILYKMSFVVFQAYRLQRIKCPTPEATTRMMLEAVLSWDLGVKYNWFGLTTQKKHKTGISSLTSMKILRGKSIHITNKVIAVFLIFIIYVKHVLQYIYV